MWQVYNVGQQRNFCCTFFAFMFASFVDFLQGHRKIYLFSFSIFAHRQFIFQLLSNLLQVYFACVLYFAIHLVCYFFAGCYLIRRTRYFSIFVGAKFSKEMLFCKCRGELAILENSEFVNNIKK